MGNCCKGQFSTPTMTNGNDRRAPPPKNNSSVKFHNDDREYISSSTSSSSSCSNSSKNCSNESNLREVKIRMTKKELAELVGWLNMADSSLEHVMARLVNVISDQSGDTKDDENNGQVVKLSQQRSWKPSLKSIPEIN